MFLRYFHILTIENCKIKISKRLTWKKSKIALKNDQYIFKKIIITI